MGRAFKYEWRRMMKVKRLGRLLDAATRPVSLRTSVNGRLCIRRIDRPTEPKIGRDHPKSAGRIRLAVGGRMRISCGGSGKSAARIKESTSSAAQVGQQVMNCECVRCGRNNG